MSWLAEILRKQHRACHLCGLGPTHLYDPEGAPVLEDGGPAEAAGPTGKPLCNGCLRGHLARDLSAFTGRCLVFEPSLGPDAFTFRALDDDAQSAGSGWTPRQREAARSALDRIGGRCGSCRGPGRFLWVAVEHDANLWSGDWLAGLEEGTLTPSQTLCGVCAAALLVASMEERGLYFEMIVPPHAGTGAADGVMFGSEA